eukprot:s106_g8.t1
MAGETLDDFLAGQVDLGVPSLSSVRLPPGLERTTDASGAGGSRPGDTFDEPPLRQDAPVPRWKCFDCGSETFARDDIGWLCANCSSRDFYNSNTPTRRTTSTGTWVYVPRPAPEPSGGDSSSASSRWGPPTTLDEASPTSPWRPSEPDLGEGHGYRETAESEQATTDATIDPDTLLPLRPSRRQRRAAAAAAGRGGKGALRPGQADQGEERRPEQARPSADHGGPDRPRRHDQGDDQSTWRGKLLKDIGCAVGRKDDNDDWSASKGPKPGVRYRGGTAPSPPAWNYAKEDIRAYDRFERKVRVWERQVKSFMPPREAAMALYVSLRGEAEEELEYMDVSQIDTDNGVENILGALRRPLQTRAIYLKRKFLHDYEYLGRHNNETVRAFCNRYQRTEKSLLAAGIDVSGMYDTEARGSRLLDRLRLTAEQQRLILVATGQSLNFDAVKDAAQMQFPEHRPTPATVHHREFENSGGRTLDAGKDQGGKQGGKGSKDPRQQRPPKGTGKSQKPFRAYVAEETQDQDDDDGGDDLPEIPEGEEGDDGEPPDEEEMIPDDGSEDEDNIETVMKEVAECLTVTARRLQGVTLGRKFSSGGKGKSVEQRKRNTHCSACGEKGHWHGDASCPMSGKGARASSSSQPPGPKPDAKKSAGPKKVFAVYHPSGLDTQTSLQDPSPEETQEFGSYFTTFMTTHTGPLREVFLSKPGDFAGYAVLDTGCQRSLCSSKWLDKHRQQLQKHKLDAKTQPEQEGFKFGTGPIQTSKLHAYFPVCLDGSGETCSLFGASVMDDDSDIPLLLSLGMIERKLKAVLDFPRNKAYLGAFDIEVPLVKISGHVCIALHNFPSEHFKKWQALSSILDQGDPDPEFVKQPATTAAHVRPDAAPFVVAGMATSGACADGSRDASSEVHVPDRPAGASQEVLAVAPGPGSPKAHRRPHREPEQGMRAPSSHVGEVGKQVREFPEVHAVRNKVEMGARSLGRTALITIATAVASLGSIWSAANLGDQAGPDFDLLNKQLFGLPSGYWTEAQGQAGTASEGRAGLYRSGGEIYEPAQGGAFGFRPEHSPGGGAAKLRKPLPTRSCSAPRLRGDRAGGAARENPQRVRLGLGGRPMKTGHTTWLVSEFRRARKYYEVEIEHRDALPTYKDTYQHPKIDLLELFAETGQITNEASYYGLAALEPFGKKFDHDLRQRAQKELAQQAIHGLQPLVIFVTWPPEFDKDSPDLYEFGAWACAEQEKAGRYFVGTAPPSSKMWRSRAIKELMHYKNVTTTTCHDGAYGQEDSEGYPAKTVRRWITNSPVLRDKLSQKLDEKQLQYQPAFSNDQGNNLHAEICGGMVHAVLQGIQTEARRRNPARFQHKHHDVLAARPLNDPEAWGHILDELERRFANTHKKPFNLTSTDPLRETIKKLVPWRLEKVQAAWTPQCRRFPQDFAFTHRGAALRLNSGEVALESEDMAQITYPKQRYVKPVRVALFFYGFPQEDPQATAEAMKEEAIDQTSTRPLHGFQTELWFEDAPREVDKQLQYSLARLHVNMGHAPKAELIRMLAASGNLSRKVLMGLDCLRCGSCLRMQKPKPPPTSSVAPAFTGYFGEILQADLVYIRLITGTAVPVLGMCCEATNYQCGKALPSRSPADVLQVLLDIWYRPLGLPLHFKCDAGGEFGGEVAVWHGQSGVLQEIVPAEAHHRLGKIERRNSLMRSLAERIIDERGVHSIEELNTVLPAVTFSMNASTYSYGRSPFQAVFGRVPRPLGDLSSDPRALVLTPQAGEKRLAPELLRADALKALAEFNASSAVKRALLRKTKHQDPSDFQAGQPLAYWRWSGRSRQHKKGAWNLGRFLSTDPDRKSLWLQVGSTTIKVATNQVRAACGWEEWTPSPEDLKILKDAEHNLRDSLWEDQTEEPPGELNEPTLEPGAMAAPPPPLPQELQRNVDYWRYRDDGVVRVHVEPRRELYVPQPSECTFDLEEIAETRRTYRNETSEQLPEDQWRDPLCHQVFDEPWTGTSTFFWKLPPGDQPRPTRELPQPLPVGPSEPLPVAGSGRRQQQRTHLQQQQQTQVGPSLDGSDADGRRQQPRTYVQQQQQQQTQVGPIIQNTIVNQQQDNRQIQFSVPGSPVPPTPRSRRGRSRTPTGRRPAQSSQDLTADSAIYSQAMESAAYSSPGVPETPQFNPAPRTPDWTDLPPQQPAPSLAPETPFGEISEAHAMHHEHHETQHELHDMHHEPNVTHNEHNEAVNADTNPSTDAQDAAAPPGGNVAFSAGGSDKNADDNEALPLLPQKRTAAVLVSSFPLNFDFFDNGEFALKDGYERDELPFRRSYYYKCYLNSKVRKDEMQAACVDEDPSREDASSDDEGLSQSNVRTQSRKELKQLDREIPWRQLVQLPRAQYEEYLEATRLECDTWMSWGGIQPVSKKEAQQILNDTKLSKRIMKARAAYRDKAKGVGPLRAKCRVVIIGCADPDIFSISRDSPTPTRLSESLLMTIATAGANREFNFSRDRWFLWASDAKSAFLQGTQDTSERAGPLFMLPPKDPLMEETQSFPADLYVITGNCYGLPNAPRVWYLRVHQKMTEGGFTRHGFDRCLYYFLNENKELVAVVIIHVDDFLATYSEKFPVEVLDGMFVWGSVTKVTPQQSATYRGKEISMIENNGRFKYVVTQKVFTDSMDSGKIPRGRSQQPEVLSPAEWSEFRSVSGSLQWLAGQTRPELGPLVSLSNRGQETTYKDLQRLYAAADYVKETSNHGLVYQDVPLNKFSAFVTYTDSSFANAGVKSQFGVCVFLTAPSVADRVEKASLVDWKSARSARVCRSTLAAEASAADEGCDRATFANLCLSELFTGEPAFKVHPQFLNLQVTDAKSLYDTVIAENPSVSDKRSLVNIRSVQQSVKPQDFRWVPTFLMLADALTKLDWKLCCQFSEFLQNPKLQLTDQGSKENKTSVKVQPLSREP